MRILFAILILCGCAAQAATNTCATCEVWEVGPALTNAAHGDTINVPAGTCEWTNAVGVYKSVNIVGAGTNATIIVDQLSSRSTPLLSITQTNYGGVLRVTGFQFRNGSNTSSHAVGLFQIKTTPDLSNAPAFRIYSNFFNAQKGRPIYFYAFSGGLVDQNVFKQDGAGGFAFDGRIFSTTNKGHISWAAPVLTGTTNEGIYIESNYFTNNFLRAITDQFAGGRTVFRYNTCYGVAAENHGTESTGEYRGGRWLSVYGNTFTWTGGLGECSVLYRSGTGVVFNNTNSGNWPNLVRLHNHRYESNYNPWKGVTGTNRWDTNYNNGEVLFSGAHTGTNGSPRYLVDTNQNWTTDELVGCSVVTGGSTNNFGLVTANTATTATFLASTFSYNTVYFTNGQNYELRRTIRALDQPGSGSGDLLAGGTSTTQPTNTVTGYPVPNADTNGYPNTIDPIYVWSNYGDVTNVNTIPNITAGRDYIVGTARPGYSALEYPHPLAGGAGGGEAARRTARATTARVKDFRN